MKTFAILAEMKQEPRFYVEAKDMDDLVRIMNEPIRKDKPYGVFPGWCPVEIKSMTTTEITNYIKNKITLHFTNSNETFIDILSGDIQKRLNLKDVTPQVCKGMQYVAKTYPHQIISTPNKGIGTTLKIRYYKDAAAFSAAEKIETIVGVPKSTSFGFDDIEELKKPTNDVIQEYLDKFKEDKRYYLADQAIINLFHAFPNNEKIEDILLKISVINDLYSTNIFATFKIAEHIRNLNIDKYLISKDLSVVNKIATGHNIHHEGKEDINFYSFATKYCNWHNQDVYPIYDQFVHKILKAYQMKDNFSNFSDTDLKDYEQFVKTIKDFKQKYNLTQHNMKEIDKFLWIYGKEKFSNYINQKDEPKQ